MSDIPSTHAETTPVPAARYARLLQTLRGNVPPIHTVAILTAVLIDARLDEPLTTGQNIRRHADLLDDMTTYSTRQIKGRFGPLANPYVVTNLPRARMIQLGVKYGQDAVIFGHRTGGKQQGMSFEWTCTRAAVGTIGQVIATRRMLLAPRVSDEKDFCDENEGFAVRCKGGPFKIPFFDEDLAQEEDFRGSKVLTYRLIDIPAHTKSVLDAYLAAETALAETLRKRDHTGHFLYKRRGVLANARVALFQATGDWKPFPLCWESTW